MFVEIHMLQNFAPSNLNRDDTNSPKDCTFGGFRRARISSQCLKRAIRTHPVFERTVQGRIAKRTKLVRDRMVERLVAAGRDAEEAASRVQRALEAVGFKWDEDHDRTAVLLFVADEELHRWTDVIQAHYELLAAPESAAPPEEGTARKKTSRQKKKEKAESVDAAVVKALKAAMKIGAEGAADVALFGRMVAEYTDMNVDAACQVAHAISTHAVQTEMDFYTAVDDLQPKEDTGAGMMGIVEFNSACFYRYAVIDTRQLSTNLCGDAGAVADGVVAFCKAAVRAIPSGKQNSFAAQNPPDWVRVELRPDAPRSLVNAFALPVRPHRGEPDLVAASIARAEDYADRLAAMFDGEDEPGRVWTASSHVRDDRVALPVLWSSLEAALAEAS